MEDLKGERDSGQKSLKGARCPQIQQERPQELKTESKPSPNAGTRRRLAACANSGLSSGRRPPVLRTLRHMSVGLG